MLLYLKEKFWILGDIHDSTEVIKLLVVYYLIMNYQEVDILFLKTHSNMALQPRGKVVAVVILPCCLLGCDIPLKLLSNY